MKNFFKNRSPLDIALKAGLFILIVALVSLAVFYIKSSQEKAAEEKDQVIISQETMDKLNSQVAGPSVISDKNLAGKLTSGDKNKVVIPPSIQEKLNAKKLLNNEAN